MELSWEDAEATALNRQEWHWNVAQCMLCVALLRVVLMMWRDVMVCVAG